VGTEETVVAFVGVEELEEGVGTVTVEVEGVVAEEEEKEEFSLAVGVIDEAVGVETFTVLLLVRAVLIFKGCFAEFVFEARSFFLGVIGRAKTGAAGGSMCLLFFMGEGEGEGEGSTWFSLEAKSTVELMAAVALSCFFF
jgi:hypothetical protein